MTQKMLGFLKMNRKDRPPFRPWGYGYYTNNDYLYPIDVFLSKSLIWIHPNILLPISNLWWEIYKKPSLLKHTKRTIELMKQSNNKEMISFYEEKLKRL